MHASRVHAAKPHRPATSARSYTLAERQWSERCHAANEGRRARTDKIYLVGCMVVGAGVGDTVVGEVLTTSTYIRFTTLGLVVYEELPVYRYWH
jgi:hypothetical protein